MNRIVIESNPINGLLKFDTIEIIKNYFYVKIFRIKGVNGD